MHLIHGLSKTRFYRIYKNIVDRCTNKNNHSFRRYGGKGVKCSWGTFEVFRDEMYFSYLKAIRIYGEKNTQIDRIDNGGNYSKENCRWVTAYTQTRNRRSNRWITYNGITLCAHDWAIKLGVHPKMIHERMGYGWPVERVLFQKPKEVRLKGQTIK